MTTEVVSGRRIILTGGSGYIGRAISRRLLDLGNQIHCIVRRTDATLVPEATAHLYAGRLEDLRQCIDDVQPDLVIHCATTIGNANDPDNIRNIVESNILLPSLLLEAMRLQGIRRFIDTGTFWQNADGTDDYAPRDFYGASKQACKDIGQKFHRLDGFSIAHLRLYDVYGLDDPRSKVVNLLVKSAATGTVIKMSPGWQYLNLVNVADVVEAYVCAARFCLASEQPFFSTFSVGHEIMQLRDVAAAVSEVLELPVDVRWGALPYRPGEIMHPPPGTLTIPGWMPIVCLREALSRSKNDIYSMAAITK